MRGGIFQEVEASKEAEELAGKVVAVESCLHHCHHLIVRCLWEWIE